MIEKESTDSLDYFMLEFCNQRCGRRKLNNKSNHQKGKFIIFEPFYANTIKTQHKQNIENRHEDQKKGNNQTEPRLDYQPLFGK